MLIRCCDDGKAEGKSESTRGRNGGLGLKRKEDLLKYRVREERQDEKYGADRRK